VSLTAFWLACLAKKCLNVTRQLLAAMAPTGKWLDEQAAELVGRAHPTCLTPTGRSGRVPDVGALHPLLTGRTELKLYPYIFLAKEGISSHLSLFIRPWDCRGRRRRPRNDVEV